MYNKIGKQAKNELLGVLHERYQRASKKDKSKILDEFVAVAKCHRKHAIRLLTSTDSDVCNGRTLDRRIYDDAVQGPRFEPIGRDICYSLSADFEGSEPRTVTSTDRVCPTAAMFLNPFQERVHQLSSC